MYTLTNDVGQVLATVESEPCDITHLEQIALSIRNSAKEQGISIPELSIYNEYGERLNHYKEDILIEHLDLNVRAFNCFKRANINYVSEILSMSISDIINIRNMGKRTTATILRALSIYLEQ